MARTERKHLVWAPDWTFHLDRNGRDNGCSCYGCSGWKRIARRKARREAKAALKREEN
jgi:hypothetical protein